ncbi:hypothetical protein OIE13_22390 [Streptosporangium sp. NBC_01810]|uniref:hypothetical protein n=1 Tax=Streptosporangium sp. NBC_01810 TaxID=2975951 RepID=UPI002DD97FC0|nr:hypothetical protein [Streptosporangium sp. NBC_01810]WSA23693.1 hypothetical protein OIE13_22390 [Streptosporangium sp. NBC_01810]
MPKHKVAVLPGEHPWSPRIEVDDHDISHGVRAISVEYQAGRIPRVQVELAMSTVEVTQLGAKEVELLVSMPDGARDALIKLGWTPPAGDR